MVVSQRLIRLRRKLARPKEGEYVFRVCSMEPENKENIQDPQIKLKKDFMNITMDVINLQKVEFHG